MSTEIAKLPTYEELVQSKDIADKNDALNYLLNKPVPKKWVKKHPFVSVKVNGQNTALEYIPIERTKLLLTQIFPGWSHTIEGVYTIFNAVCVVVRLKVTNPFTGAEIIHDGIGAVDIQTKKDSSPADMVNIVSSAVMKAAPSAESYAIKNAAEKLGSLFGGNLQKYDIDAFNPIYNQELKKTLSQQLQATYGTTTESK